MRSAKLPPPPHTGPSEPISGAFSLEKCHARFGDRTGTCVREVSATDAAHTNKNRAASGKLIHAGTSDLVEDFDSVHMLEAIDGVAGKAEKLIKVQASKRILGHSSTQTSQRYAHLSDDKLMAAVEAGAAGMQGGAA